jgi:hypothetical protein
MGRLVDKMNNKIEELAGQVTEDILGVKIVNQKKFAKLIVQECVRYFNEDYKRDFDVLWREDLSKCIKEHFGVEE